MRALHATFIPFADSLLRIAATPGALVVALDAGGLASVDLAAGVLTPLRSTLKNKWGDPPTFSGLCARSDGLLLASIDDAWLARVGDGALTSERKVGHGGEAFAGAVTAASDAAGDVCVVSAYRTLVRVAAKGTSPSVKAGDDLFWGAAVAADGSVVASGRASGVLELREPKTLAVRSTLTGLQAPPLALAFSPDGRWLVASDDTTRAFLWDLQSGTSTPLQGMAKVVAFAWLPDSSGFYAVELTRHIARFEPAHPEQPVAEVFPEGLETRYLIDATLLPDGRLVCVVEQRGLLLVE